LFGGEDDEDEDRLAGVAVEVWQESEEWVFAGRRHLGWSGYVKMPPKSTSTPCPGWTTRKNTEKE